MGKKEGNSLPFFLVPRSSFAGTGGREKELADVGIRENRSDAFRRREGQGAGRGAREEREKREVSWTPVFAPWVPSTLHLLSAPGLPPTFPASGGFGYWGRGE